MEDKLLEYADKVEQALAQYGPEAYEMAVKAQFYDGLGSIITGFVLLLIVAGLGFGVRFLVRRGSKVAEESTELFSSLELPYYSGAVIVGAVGTTLLLRAMMNLLDTWNWVSIFDPELAFLREVVTQVTQ